MRPAARRDTVRRDAGRVARPIPPRDPAAAGSAGQPHRRRRGDRAPGGGGEGTGRERARRRRPPHRGRARGRRDRPHRGHRRRRRHGRGRTRPRRAAPRHLQARRRRSCIRIATLGFRGEALPSIGAAARLAITARPEGAAACLGDPRRGRRVSARSRPPPARPARASWSRDLFFATPARRKFLKQPRTEADAAEAAVRRLALAAPRWRSGWKARAGWRSTCRRRTAPPGSPRCWGRRRRRRCCSDGRRARRRSRLTGFACAPTGHRATGAAQGLVVNGRPVADPVLQHRGPRRLSRRDCRRPPCGGGAVARPAARDWSTSTCIPPRPSCASAIPTRCARW